jgi:aryl-alcohol dehydrogenase-like predicted oxidoreductase
MRRSAKLVETALELGIRHFDVAPSYGMGTAEEVLGAVLESVPDITITTKVGIPRPGYARGRALVRYVAKPLLDRQRSLKSFARGTRQSPPGDADRSPFFFASDTIRRSLEESLDKLRRPSVDVLLLHEPQPSDLHADTAHCLERLTGEGLVSAYGVGIDACGQPWREFGSIWQSRWPGSALGAYQGAVSYVFHGVVRYAASGESPRAAVDAALERAPDSVLLVSASTPARLRELLQGTGRPG